MTPENELKHCIYELLKKLNIRPSNSGYVYISEAIEIRYSQLSQSVPLTNMGDIYETIANRRNGKYKTVERAIRYARRNIYTDSSAKPLIEHIFGNPTRISNSEFISGLANYIMHEMINNIETNDSVSEITIEATPDTITESTSEVTPETIDKTISVCLDSISGVTIEAIPDTITESTANAVPETIDKVVSVCF